MPRKPRDWSRSGYMHVIERGIGKQALFIEKYDFTHYLKGLERFSRETDVTVCAYCLMDNHVHLLLHNSKEQVSMMMKKIGVSYSYFFNQKYQRTGHLFQDRYLSEKIEGDSHFLTVFRYILKNPEKAGICIAQNYPWSSYSMFEKPSSFIDTSLAMKLLGSRYNYTSYIASDNNDECMEFERTAHDDAWGKSIIQKLTGLRNGLQLQQFDKAERNTAIKKLKSAGMSNRQIERLTGINRGIIQRA